MKPEPTISHPLVLRVLLTILLALAYLGTWLPPTWLWGVNHGLWLSWPFSLGLFLTGLLAVWSTLGRKFGLWLILRFEPHLLQNKIVAYGLVPVIGTVVFWLFRDPVHMLGDGQTLAVMVADDRLFHGFDFMTYHLVARLYQAVGGGGEAMAFVVFAWLSCLSGAVYLAVAAWSARHLAATGGGRILLYGLLVIAAPTQLFFGYAEVYAPLSVALLAFLTFFMLCLQGRSGLLAVAVSWSIGLFFHLNALFLAPLLIVALVLAPSRKNTPIWRRMLTLAWPALVALAVAGCLHLVGGYDLPQLRSEFGGGGSIFVSVTGQDGLLTWRHLKDSLNLLLLLAPLPLVLWLSGRSFSPASRRSDFLRLMLMAGSIWLLVLVTLVHLKLGVVRDWDLFAPHMSLLVLTGWYTAVGHRDQAGPEAGVVGSILVVALVLMVPWFAVNAGQERVLARLEAVGADLSPYPHGLLHEQMAYCYQAAGDQGEAARHYRRAGEVCPANLRFHAIYGTFMLNQGELATAAAAYDRALAADSTYAYGLKMAVTVRVLQQDYEAALPLARRQWRLGRQDAAGAENHGAAAEQTGRIVEAIGAYKRAAAMNPSRQDLLARAGGLHLQNKQYGPAEEIFRRLLTSDAPPSQAALGLADAIWGDFLVHSDQRPPAENRARLAEVVRLVDAVLATMDAQEPSAPSLRTWRNEVLQRAAGLAE